MSWNDAGTLLRLYPRPWRERYGEEFLATAGEQSLHPQQVIDVVSGAIDAWLSGEVRRAVRVGNGEVNPGGSMLKAMLCETNRYRASKRDALMGAAVMIGLSMLFAALLVAADRAGMQVLADVLKVVAVGGPLLLSMPFWMTKGQPWRAQAAFITVLMTIQIAIGYLAAVN